MEKSVTRIALAVALGLACAGLPGTLSAEVKTKTVTYKDGDVTLKGLMAWDEAKSGKRPGILVVHEWWGLNDYVKGRAKKLAEAGYVAFALDMYGGDKVTNHPDQAGKWMKEITGNIETWKRRAKLGLDVLRADPNVDGGKTAAIGYCFGGSTVMQMAYAGQDVRAVASFHGSLPPASESVTSIKPRVFVAHGRDDKFIPADRIAAFQAGLDRAKATWEMIIFSGTRHGFTNPDAGSYGLDNLAYNETADKRSWAAMLTMFDDVFK